jgi:hypothetical protein
MIGQDRRRYYCRHDNLVPFEEGRRIATLIPNANSGFWNQRTAQVPDNGWRKRSRNQAAARHSRR